MGLSFPIRDRVTPGLPAAPGFPSRADHCVCIGGPMVFQGQDTCQRCGRHPKDIVSDTWRTRAEARRAEAARRKERKR